MEIAQPGRGARRLGFGIAAALLTTGLMGTGPAHAATPVPPPGPGWLDAGGANVAVPVIKDAAGAKLKTTKVDTASLTGAGIGVALIDSGVAPVPGLSQPGKVINGPDLSFESQTPGLEHLDTYGHGTHMAGIIAGSDPANGFEGIAPGSHLISLKTAAADGAVDVSQVIAAIDWVVTHRNDPGMNIRVINLSFGTDSVQPELVDPLSYAVESAWRQGIVVVTSSGNDGAARMTMPAANPYVISVGAADTNGTADRSDDTVASFSNRGTATRHPDLVATGRSVVSLRDPGSYIDTTYPTARVGDRFFRGSGTSQAAAVVSGSVALLLQQRPALTPDQVKRLLMQTADPLAVADPIGGGAGQLDVAGAAAADVPRTADVTQAWPAATGLGSLEASRGTAHVVDGVTGLALTGERDIFGMPWVPATWAATARIGRAWTGGTWNGAVWTGTGFVGSTWPVTTWTGRSWAGRSWAGSDWAGRSWAGGTWTGRSWAGGTWAGRSWAGRSWA
ncbi:peptidase S8 and S53 subtilisin kexin sedolisin [Actinoplanes sp. SE50]|uniref:S8 family serine peptidase n=1 Tax=unclassified Actinoplanes TaxID=2626549 RepID=UPI00023ED479|nr:MULTISPECIES: S8 family serine peptidase [unclassified Actinoplanes]AEV85617.1 peptidase S8 and S53 subtilisin kexin sedolisin [Actinoplanes sp. SE50/110]ATO84010.1 peptidase S8 and S53 subtilisin kexin sedolisin [Actinoplanes sp. SE50]SLM01420.1 peptidase S8 [Actinoplanes sp. SE50/110]